VLAALQTVSPAVRAKVEALVLAGQARAPSACLPPPARSSPIHIRLP
jgi:hypothetical protein